MNWLDPDHPDPGYLQSLVDILDAPMRRATELILHPKGATPASIEWNQNRHIQASAEMSRVIQSSKQQLGTWTGRAIGASASEGHAAALRQIVALQKSGAFAAAGRGPIAIRAGFDRPNLDVVKALAHDTYRDGSLALDNTGNQVQQLLRKMSDNGLTGEQVNKIMTKSVIEGTPMSAQIEIRDLLEKIHGEQIVFPSGHVMPVGDYAKTLARTRLREAHVVARHGRLRKDGVLYVTIIGRISRYPCTSFLTKIFYIGEGADPLGRYPNLNTLHDARGGAAPPFHCNCSKSTAPIIIEATPAAQLDEGEPDATSEKIGQLGTSSTAARRLADTVNVQAQGRDRVNSLAESIRERARKNGYTPPPWSPGYKDVAKRMTEEP